jgi:hypothetical protein
MGLEKVNNFTPGRLNPGKKPRYPLRWKMCGPLETVRTLFEKG